MSRMTDESLSDAIRYAEAGMVERPLLAMRPGLGADMSQALLNALYELRERRAADLSPSDVQALRDAVDVLRDSDISWFDDPFNKEIAVAALDKLIAAGGKP